MTSLPSRRHLLMAGTGLLAAPTIIRNVRTHDSLATFDQQVVDATGAFLVSELERMDPDIHLPLSSVTWGRDVDVREDVTIGDELSSYTISSYAAPGGINPGGKAWIGKDTNVITGIGLDIGKQAQPLNLWGMELSYTLPELDSAMRLGRPVDTQKYEGIKLKHQMDIDEQVYIGDASLGNYGLVNSPLISRTDATQNGTGAGAARALWANKTTDQLIADISGIIATSWAAAAWSTAPASIRLPPAQFNELVTRKVSEAGNISVLEYLKTNTLSNTVNNRPLDIQPLKWLVGRGAGGTDRMLAYTRRKDFVRFPMTPLNRTPVENRSIYQLTTYYCRLGIIEFVYPETVAYVDGI